MSSFLNSVITAAPEEVLWQFLIKFCSYSDWDLGSEGGDKM